MEPMIAASLLVMGLLVATRLRVPGPVAALLVGAFAAFHGLAHGYELAGEPGAAPVSYTHLDVYKRQSQRSAPDHCADKLAWGLHRSPQRASSVQHSGQMAPR